MNDKDLLDDCEYLTVDQVLELPTFRHLKAKTLAKYRQLGIGPKYFKIGGKGFWK